jgi:UDP-3-O-[3-hydroxymyristoyl] glucosamine N-acyltransferase
MKSRILPSIAPGTEVEFQESIIVQGDIGAGAKVSVKGSLEVTGNIEAGAKIDATGRIKTYAVTGPDTTLYSRERIAVNFMIGDHGSVHLRSPCSVTGACIKKISDNYQECIKASNLSVTVNNGSIVVSNGSQRTQKR